MRHIPQNGLNVRRANRSTVLRQIYFNDPTSRLAISRSSGLSPATVTNVVSELLERGLVIETGAEESAGGRPRTLLATNPTYAYLVGITIRAWYVYIELFDLVFHPLAKAAFTFNPAQESEEQVLERIGAELDGLLVRTGVSRARLLGVGIGISAIVDPESGVVLYSPLIGWRESFPLRAILADMLHLPVYVENGARTVVFAEALARTRHHLSSLATLMIGRALGAGIVLGGDLYRGFTNSAGGWAHTCVVRNGRTCHCGNQGCLDAYVGAPGIICTYDELGPAAPLPEQDEYEAVATIVARARDGEAQAITALQETTAYLGIGVANFVNLFDPELVVIGGRAGAIIGEYVVAELRAIVARHSHRKPFDVSRIIVSSLGVNALTRGPAALVLDRFLRLSDSLFEAHGAAQIPVAR